MKIIKTELVYVPKDLCSNALVSKMSINDKDTITDTTILVMADCFSVVRLPYLNLNVMFCEVDCMTIINNCTRQLVSTVLRKNPIERKKLTNYITIDEFLHETVAKSDHATRKSKEAHQYDLTLWKWHSIIEINRFDNLIRGGVYVPACRPHLINCGDIRNRQSCIVTHSSVYNTGETAVMNTELYDSGSHNCYQRVYLCLNIEHIRTTYNKVKTK